MDDGRRHQVQTAESATNMGYAEKPCCDYVVKSLPPGGASNQHKVLAEIRSALEYA